MKIFKRLGAVVLGISLFFCGSGFISNKYEDSLKLELKTDKTAGFDWNIEQFKKPGEFEKKDKKAKKFEKRDEHFEIGEVAITTEFEANADKELIGAPGITKVKIEGEKEGTCFIKGEYKRPGDNKMPEEIIFLVVEVNSEKKVKLIEYKNINKKCCKKPDFKPEIQDQE